MTSSETRPPLPPFSVTTAVQKVRGAEDAWNTRDPEICARVYTEDTRWRNRAEFPVGREEVKAFLRRKWVRELDYRLIKELGPSPRTSWRCVLPTSGMTTLANGFAAMATKTGALTPPVS